LDPKCVRRAQAEDGGPRNAMHAIDDIDDLMDLGEWIVLELDTDDLAGAACMST
jgi:hypothetical protein